MPTREQMWDLLGEEVDLLVVGGGVNGCGIARDAARRGLSVALVEMRDLAFGTSSRSSKLIHGGLRYLEQYEFSLVFESVSERRVLMDLAPHLVNPLGFLFPVYEGSKHKLWVINAGMWLYDGLSLFRSPKRHKNLRSSEVAELEPAVGQEGLQGAPLYYDCSTDDARLTLETALDAAEHGATIATWAKVERFITDDSGRVRGAVIKNVLDGSSKEIRAQATINATGPWTDAVLGLAGGEERAPLLRPTKGVHIVVDTAKLPLSNAVVCLHPTDDRVLFAIPWGDRTYVGTTDTDFDDDPADVAATSEDVSYLVDAASAYFPEYPITRDDVISTWAGIRPLIAPATTDGEVDESQVSREHTILVGQDGLITVAGGKLTTYRRTAGEVVDTAVRLLKLSGALKGRKLDPAGTDDEPLPGGVGWPEDDEPAALIAEALEASGGTLDEARADALVHTYGTRARDLAALCASDAKLAERLVPERPEILAQVDWAVTHELAASLSDLMIRRTQLFFRDHKQGLDAAITVAAHMSELLGWSDAQREAQLADYRAEVALSRRWRQD